MNRCPRCYGSLIGSFGEIVCLACGWDGPTRPPTALESWEAGQETTTQQAETSSEYKGVSKRKNRWIAQISTGGKKVQYVGSFKTEILAAKAADTAYEKLGLKHRNLS